MTMPRKGTHTATVDGKVYRYRYKATSTASDSVRVIIERSDLPGGLINAVIEAPHVARVRMHSSHIERIVRKAISLGWDPAKSRKKGGLGAISITEDQFAGYFPELEAGGRFCDLLTRPVKDLDDAEDA